MGGQELGGRGVFNNFQGKVFSCRTCQNNNDPGSTRRPPFSQNQVSLHGCNMCTEDKYNQKQSDAGVSTKWSLFG